MCLVSAITNISGYGRSTFMWLEIYKYFLENINGTQCCTKTISVKKKKYSWLLLLFLGNTDLNLLCIVQPVKMCPVDNMDHLTTIFSCRRKNN